ncbi:quinone oxidoreductase family protein [Companilactobacillus halodurans]|nr:zinc-binding alcohol dehydrogenase family protein [Companilactobacillus halodurans]
MKAAIVKGAGINPVYATFKEPEATKDELKINVSAAALSNFTKNRALGNHYSSTNDFPIIAGADGVGTTSEGKRVYFLMPTAPFGSLAQQTIVNKNLTVPIPKDLDDVSAAAIANPGMSSWVALVYRAHFEKGQTVLINGATGSAGSLAVKIAYHLGAKKVIVTGRNAKKLANLGADAAVSFDMIAENGATEFAEKLNPYFKEGVDVVLDYLWGDSSLAIMTALAKAGNKNKSRFVSVGAASGQNEISLPSALLRSSTIEILGSGAKSASMQ